MLTHALSFLIRSLAEFFELLLLARFYLQLARVSFANPIGQFVLALTNWFVFPVRCIFKPFRNYDIASLFLAFFTSLLMQILLLLITPWHFIFASTLSIIALLGAALLELFKMSLFLLFMATLGMALISWVAPYNAIVQTFSGLTAWFLKPLRRIIPPVGGVDITPWLLILFIQLMLNVFVGPLESMILQEILIAT